LTSFISTNIYRIEEASQVEASLKYQLIFSTLLMTPVLYYLAIYSLPQVFSFSNGLEVTHVKNIYAFICTALGLWSGLIIGYFTEYFTSNAYSPVQKLAKACATGAAPNIIEGLALGYNSTIIPVLSLAVTIFVSFTLANMYGISLAALGMLSTLSIALTIDGYGPISDNAGGIAEMSELVEARQRTDILDAAGNTTAAIGKGFAIGSATLVALALFGAFVTRSHMTTVDILKPMEFSCLVIGAMLPYAFSAMTMSAVGDAA
jgi:inorganic pyrophosphatase